MLKVDNLTFEVNEEGRKRCLVNHVSFQVADGEMLVITGPNGGGKSTLAKVLAGIEKADEGRIFLDEENISGYDIDHRANAGIGYAFQQPPRFKGMTVARMLSLAAGKELTRSRKLQTAFGSRTLFRRLSEPTDGRHTLRWRDEASGDCDGTGETAQGQHF